MIFRRKPKHNLVNVHDKSQCKGQHCAIHKPSKHHMRKWPLNWRADRRIMERICKHGVGHDDPDDLAYRKSVNPDVTGDHGCDGCCHEVKR